MDSAHFATKRAVRLAVHAAVVLPAIDYGLFPWVVFRDLMRCVTFSEKATICKFREAFPLLSNLISPLCAAY